MADNTRTGRPANGAATGSAKAKVCGTCSKSFGILTRTAACGVCECVFCKACLYNQFVPKSELEGPVRICHGCLEESVHAELAEHTQTPRLDSQSTNAVASDGDAVPYKDPSVLVAFRTVVHLTQDKIRPTAEKADLVKQMKALIVSVRALSELLNGSHSLVRIGNLITAETVSLTTLIKEWDEGDTEAIEVMEYHVENIAKAERTVATVMRIMRTRRGTFVDTNPDRTTSTS